MSVKKIVFRALGEKASVDSKEADQIAWFRVFLMVQMIITNAFIVCGVIRHW